MATLYTPYYEAAERMAINTMLVWPRDLSLRKAFRQHCFRVKRMSEFRCLLTKTNLLVIRVA